MQEIHIGRIIHEELKRQERTPAWLAKKINCDRTNIYHIIVRKSIDTALLMKISVALQVNFFECFKPLEGEASGEGRG